MNDTMTHGQRRPPTIAAIQGSVADAFGITVSEMLSRRRRREIVRPRMAAMYLAVDLTPASLPQIGRTFDRDHTTVMHACSVIEGLIGRDSEFAERVEAAAAQALRLSGDPGALLQHAALEALGAYFEVARRWVLQNPEGFIESGFGAIPAPRLTGLTPSPSGGQRGGSSNGD